MKQQQQQVDVWLLVSPQLWPGPLSHFHFPCHIHRERERERDSGPSLRWAHLRPKGSSLDAGVNSLYYAVSLACARLLCLLIAHVQRIDLLVRSFSRSCSVSPFSFLFNQLFVKNFRSGHCSLCFLFYLYCSFFPLPSAVLFIFLDYQIFELIFVVVFKMEMLMLTYFVFWGRSSFVRQKLSKLFFSR